MGIRKLYNLYNVYSTNEPLIVPNMYLVPVMLQKLQLSLKLAYMQYLHACQQGKDQLLT